MKVNVFVNQKFMRKEHVNECVQDYLYRCKRYVNVNLLYKIDEGLLYSDSSYNINVCTSGNYVSSIDFSNILKKCSLNRFKNVNIFFGYNHFNNKNDVCFCNFDIESSGFLYVMVLEQVYRSYKIINNETYHK